VQSYEEICVLSHVFTRFNRFGAFKNRCFFLRILQYVYAKALYFNILNTFWGKTAQADTHSTFSFAIFNNMTTFALKKYEL